MIKYSIVYYNLIILVMMDIWVDFNFLLLYKQFGGEYSHTCFMFAIAQVFLLSS